MKLMIKIKSGPDLESKYLVTSCCCKDQLPPKKRASLNSPLASDSPGSLQPLSVSFSFCFSFSNLPSLPIMSSFVLFQLWFVLLTLLSGHSFLDLAPCKRALEQAQLAFQVLGFPPDLSLALLLWDLRECPRISTFSFSDQLSYVRLGKMTTNNIVEKIKCRNCTL